MTRQHDYILGYGKGAMQWMTSRTAEGHGAFLLPYLQPNMRFLDCGCGPGSLTVGYATYVAPGEIIGIDKEPKQFANAIEYAAREKLTNIRFDTGNIFDLPYPDESFDVVFASAVLGNIEDPAAMIAEMVRVLKPGGYIALKEFDHGGDVIAPLTPVIAKSIELYLKLRTHNKHADNVGRQLRQLVHEAGCKVDYVHGLYQPHDGPNGLRDTIDRNSHLIKEILGPMYIELGWTTAEELAEHDAAWIEFAEDPRSIYVSCWFEAVGIKS